MKIAVAAKGSDLNARVCERFGSCPYILVIDIDSFEYEAFPVSKLGKQGVPAEIIANILRLGVKGIIVGFMSPRLSGPLVSKGFEVITGVSGKVEDVVSAYREKKLEKVSVDGKVVDVWGKTREDVKWALQKTGKEFLSIIPVLVSVILLVGLCETFISRKFLLSIFSGKPLRDSVMGAFWGSVLIGNPVNSYVIGDVLVKNGVSLYAVAAFLTTWITVGFIQLPVEIETLGMRFALGRTVASFFVSIIISFLAVLILQIFQ